MVAETFLTVVSVDQDDYTIGKEPIQMANRVALCNISCLKELVQGLKSLRLYELYSK